MKALTIAILAALTFQANARMNETLEQCTVRYGEPVSKANNEAHFIKNGFAIATYFLPNGKVGGMLFEKKDNSGFITTNEDIPEEQIVRLLIINSSTNNSDWQELPKQVFKRHWRTSDGKTIAVYDTLSDRLYLSSSEMLEKIVREAKQERSDELKGF